MKTVDIHTKDKEDLIHSSAYFFFLNIAMMYNVFIIEKCGVFVRSAID